ncbi:hypothetical protein KXS07_02495 [Inquilinus limosus]|uniref:hypothetical protein n=1 Tax=Inquilinus limosus TaxID=171674 RepID=UPI003F174352
MSKLQGSQSPLAHVDRARLFATGSREPELYARMIDGRTIFQYLIFVEPVLRSANPERTREIYPSAASGLSCPQDFFVLAREVDKPCATLTGSRLVPLPLIDVTSEQSVRLKDAIEIVDTSGLGFFVDFGVSHVTTSVDATLDNFAAVVNADGASALNIAVSILKQAAQNLFEIWARAEDGNSATIESSDARLPLLPFQDIFARSVVVEFLRRIDRNEDALRWCNQLEEAYFRLNSPDKFIDEKNTQFHLTYELISYWLPLWNRAAVIFNSPFDTMSSLGGHL